jgi:hypothetical protein
MRILSTLTAFIIAGISFAQNIQWGELNKSPGRVISILPVANSAFYTYRWSGGALLGSPALGRHEDFSLLTQEKIQMKVEGSAANFNDAISIDGKVIVFLTDRRDGQNKLFMQEYGGDCMPSGSPRELAEYTLPKGWKRASYFNVLQSENQQFFCVEYSIPGRNDEHDRFGFKVLNADFETVSEGEYESPYEANKSDVSNRYLSNTGDYFIAMKVYNLNEKGRVKDYSSLEKFVLMQVDEDGVEEINLDLGDKHISEVTFSSDNNSLLTFNGLYGQGVSSAKGVFYFQVDFRKKEIINEGFNEFGNDFITEGWSDRAKEKASKREAKGKGTPALYNYEIRDNITLADGSMIGMIEQYYVRVVTTTDSKGNTRTTYYYYYNDVIVYKVAQTGEFEWLKKIPKRQVSTNDGGYLSSVASYVTNDKLVIFFNDNLKNYDEGGNFLNGDSKLDYASYRKKTNCVARVELDLASGEGERKTFFGRGEAEAIAVPKLFQTDYKNKEMLILLQIGKKEKFGLISFGD